MQNVQVDSNHTPQNSARVRFSGDTLRFLHAVEVIEEIGGRPSLIATGHYATEITAELQELRQIRAFAAAYQQVGKSEQFVDSQGPPKLWTIAMLAKQLGMKEATVRRRKADWPFIVCVAHSNCRGGTRGCDLRAPVAEAAQFISHSRAKGKRR